MMMLPSIFGENLFDNFMENFAFPEFSNIDKVLYGKNARNLMKTDVKETNTDYEMDIDLPGFQKEEVKVSLENGYLTICAIKDLDKNEQEADTGKYIRKERYSGTCERSFYVGKHMTENDIRGEFKHGILKLTIPKKEIKPAIEEKKYISLEG